MFCIVFFSPSRVDGFQIVSAYYIIFAVKNQCHDRRQNSSVALAAVAVTAKHLEIFGDGLSAFRPGDDMVAFHFAELPNALRIRPAALSMRCHIAATKACEAL